MDSPQFGLDQPTGNAVTGLGPSTWRDIPRQFAADVARVFGRIAGDFRDQVGRARNGVAEARAEIAARQGDPREAYETGAAQLLAGKDQADLSEADLARIDRLWAGLNPQDQDNFLEDRMNGLVPDHHPFVSAWSRAEEAYAVEQRAELAAVREEYENGYRDPEDRAYDREIQVWEENGIAEYEAREAKALLSVYEYKLASEIDRGRSFDEADRLAKASGDLNDDRIEKLVPRSGFSEETWNTIGDAIIGRDPVFGATGADRLFTIRDATRQPEVAARIEAEIANAALFERLTDEEKWDIATTVTSGDFEPERYPDLAKLHGAASAWLDVQEEYEQEFEDLDPDIVHAEKAGQEQSEPRALLSYYEHTLGRFIDAGYSFDRADKAAKAEALADQAAKELGGEVADHGFDKAVPRAAFSEATWAVLGAEIAATSVLKGQASAFDPSKDLGLNAADRLFAVRDAALQPDVTERLDREARQTFRLSPYEIGLGEIIESGARTPVGHSLDGMWDSGASRVVDQVVGRDAFSRSTWESLAREIVGETAPPAMQSAKAGITPFEQLAAQRIATRDWSPAHKSDTPEFNRVWSGLAEVLPLSGYGTGQDLSQFGRDGEYWQYMGTNNSSGADVHYFRHREHPQHQGANLWLYVPDKMIGTGELAQAASQGHDFRNEPRSQQAQAWAGMDRQEKAAMVADYYKLDAADQAAHPFHDLMARDLPNLDKQALSIWAIIETRTGGEMPDREEVDQMREDFAAWGEKLTGGKTASAMTPEDHAAVDRVYGALTTAEVTHLDSAVQKGWMDADHPLAHAHQRSLGEIDNALGRGRVETGPDLHGEKEIEVAGHER